MKRKLAVLLACAMFITAAAPAESALAASGTTSTVKQQVRTTVNKTVKTPQRGWYTLKNGQKRYFRNSTCLKGLQKIANRRYFFDVKTGVMKTNNVTYRRVLYYINEKGIVEGWKRGRNYYNSNGRRLSGDREQQFTAYQNARKVVSRITNKKMTQEQKLRACFRWVMPFPRADWRLFAQGGKSWYATFANDIFERKSGNCLSSAGAFAYLAKACGVRNVYICTNGPRQWEGSHGWVEINGLVYDTYWAQRRGFRRFYATSYKKYYHEVYMRIRLS